MNSIKEEPSSVEKPDDYELNINQFCDVIKKEDLDEFDYKLSKSEDNFTDSSYANEQSELCEDLPVKTEHKIENECEFDGYITSINCHLKREDNLVFIKEEVQEETEFIDSDECKTSYNATGEATFKSEGEGNEFLKLKYEETFVPSYSNDSEYTNNITPIQTFKCPICNFEAFWKDAFQTHLKTVHAELATHSKQNLHKCLFCSFATDSRENLSSHIEETHFEDEYKCEICGYATVHKSSLVKHVKVKHGETKLHVCHACPFSSPFLDSFQLHVKLSHTKDTAYECEMCDYKTDKKTLFLRHVRFPHTNARFKKKSCKRLLPKVASNDSGSILKKILVRKNDDVASECDFRKCETVRNGVASECDFRKYETVQNSDEFESKPIEHKCLFCIYKADSRESLSSHIQATHFDNITYSCEVCDYRTVYKSALTQHVRHKHGESSLHKCESCGFKTAFEEAFKTHLALFHTKDKAYQCEVCDFKTVGRHVFLSHVQAKHSARKTQKCALPRNF